MLTHEQQELHAEVTSVMMNFKKDEEEEYLKEKHKKRKLTE